MPLRIPVPTEEIAGFCRRHGIVRLRAFGSVLRDDFTPESDVNLIVEFQPGTPVGLLTLAGLEIGLSELLGRKVDPKKPKKPGRYFRDRVLAEAEVLYETR